MYGPCKTWMAWLVTEPELLATGLAVALTPPTSEARTAVGSNDTAFSNTNRKELNC
jgi:hypothetical protein